MGVVAFFVFSLLYLTPGDPAAVIAGDIATAEDIARIRAQLGLDEPFLVQFGTWLWRVLHGDLGISIFTNLPVTRLIGQRLEPTVALTVCTLFISVVVAVPLGVVAAWKVGHVDRPRGDGLLGARLLGAGLRASPICSSWCSRSSSTGCRCRAMSASPNGFWPFLAAHDPADARARHDLMRADRAHHARQHARGAEPGLHPHRAGQGPRGRARC